MCEGLEECDVMVQNELRLEQMDSKLRQFVTESSKLF
jgi:hypothetical protein